MNQDEVKYSLDDPLIESHNPKASDEKTQTQPLNQSEPQPQPQPQPQLEPKLETQPQYPPILTESIPKLRPEENLNSVIAKENNNLMHCTVLPTGDVQPTLFSNCLFNPQFDVYNPIFGTKISDQNKNHMQSAKTGNVLDDSDAARLFSAVQSDDPYNQTSKKILKRVMPFFPLEKTEGAPEYMMMEESEEGKRKLAERNKLITITVYKEIVLLLFQIFFLFFVLDMFPNYIATVVKNDTDWGRINFSDPSVQILQFILSIITFFILIIMVKLRRDRLQEKFLLNLNSEFMFTVLYSNLPRSTTLYDIIEFSRKTLGPNYGIIDIVFVNNYKPLEKIHNYVKEKERFFWKANKKVVERDPAITEDSINEWYNIRKEKIKEETRMIKLGTRFTGAAFVVYQTQEMAEEILFTNRIINPCFVYNFNRARIKGYAISLDYCPEPSDLIWSNLEITRFSSRTRILSAYILIILLLAFTYAPIVGVNLIGMSITKIDGYAAAYGFPFLAAIYSLIVNVIFMFLIRYLGIIVYSSELVLLSTLTFPLTLGASAVNLFQVHESKLEHWEIHYVVGNFLALLVVSPLKRFVTVDFIKSLCRKIKMSYWTFRKIKFNRVQYEKYKEVPSFSWSAPMSTLLDILCFIFIAKYVCIYSIIFVLILTMFIWGIDSYLMLNMNLEIKTIMIAKAFFGIFDHAIYFLALSNGVVPLILGRSLLGIIWLVFLAGWIYVQNYLGIKMECFFFKIYEKTVKLLQNSKFEFLPWKYRKFVISIDRSLELLKKGKEKGDDEEEGNFTTDKFS